jgi:hypothetical protein
MNDEIFVPHTKTERENCMALAEYLSRIFYC